MTIPEGGTQQRRKLSSRTRRFLSRAIAAVLCVIIGVFLVIPNQLLAHAPVWGHVLAALILILLCWFTIRELGRLAHPAVMRRLSDQTTGPMDFTLRALAVVLVAGMALRVSGVSLQTIVATGTVGVVLLGLAAQQSLGNILAGVVLVGVHPYRVGDLVRMQGSTLGGAIEGRVTTMGLFYTRLKVGDDYMHVPNAAVLGATVTPLQDPHGVDVRVRLAPGVRPNAVVAALAGVATQTRRAPHIDLEEVDDERVVVRVRVVPKRSIEGPKLAEEVISAIAPFTGEDALARR